MFLIREGLLCKKEIKLKVKRNRPRGPRQPLFFKFAGSLPHFKFFPHPSHQTEGKLSFIYVSQGWFGQILLEMNLVVHSGENALNYNTLGYISWGPVCEPLADARPQEEGRG